MAERLHLQPKHREVLEALLREHLPDVEVWAYGSRVSGKSHDGSDLDLVLRGPGLSEIPPLQLGDFEEAVRESSIPFLVEARDWARLPERFHHEVERDHVVLVRGKNNRTTKSLGDYFTLKRGTTYKSRLVGQPGPLLLGLSTIQRNGGFRSDSLKTYGGDAPENLLVEPGDLYVSLKDITQAADLLGAVARLPSDQPSGRLTQDTVKLIPKNDNIFVDYIYWLLRTPQYRNYCRAHATGTTNLGLPRVDFLAYPIPHETESRLNVVNLLNDIDDRMELNRRMNETLEAMARTLFKSWFVDFDPVRAKMEGRDPGLPQPLADLFPDRLVDSESGKIPEGWVPRPLDESFTLTMGQSPPGSTYNERGKGLPFFQGRTDFGFRYPENRKFCTAPTRIAWPGDTLVSVRAPVGDINMAWEKCCIGRGVAALRHKSNSSSFTYYSTWAMQEDISVYEHTGTVFGAINRKQFEALPTPNPPQGLVEKFDTMVDPMDDRIKRNTLEMQMLTKCRDLLLPKLISGDIRICDAESMVGAVA